MVVLLFKSYYVFRLGLGARVATFNRYAGIKIILNIFLK